MKIRLHPQPFQNHRKYTRRNVSWGLHLFLSCIRYKPRSRVLPVAMNSLTQRTYSPAELTLETHF